MNAVPPARFPGLWRFRCFSPASLLAETPEAGKPGQNTTAPVVCATGAA